MSAVAEAVASAHRREWAYVLAATVRVTRDIDAAEEAVQDAYVQALRTWAADGVPSRPGAWLTTVARRNALNVMRRGRTLAAKLPLLVSEEAERRSRSDPRRPAAADLHVLPSGACRARRRSRLTLRLVCGVATPDIAQAFLVAEPTMAARLTRAKKKIAAARIPYAVPAAEELPARLSAVLSVDPPAVLDGPHRAVGRLSRTGGADLARPGPGPDAACCCCRPTGRWRGCWRCCWPTTRAARPVPTPDGRLLRLEEQDRSRWDRRADRRGGPAGGRVR